MFLQEGISDILDDITARFQFGDWRLLQLLAANLAPTLLGELVVELDSQQTEHSQQRSDLPSNDSNANLRKPLLTPI